MAEPVITYAAITRSSSTQVTPGADQAACSAAWRSAHEETVPFRVTLSRATLTLMRSASTSAARRKATFDIRLDFRWHNSRLLEGNQIADAPDSGQVVHSIFGRRLLILVVDFAFQCDPPVGHLYLNAIGGDPNIPLQPVDSRLWRCLRHYEREKMASPPSFRQ